MAPRGKECFKLTLYCNMIARTQKVSLSIEELDTLLTGYTDNGVTDTLPEVMEALNSSEAPHTPIPSPSGISYISDEEINLICV